MFERSVEENNLRYTDFYGDSKSFSEVKNTYTGIEVQKQECIGHVQKRVGTALELKIILDWVVKGQADKCHDR